MHLRDLVRISNPRRSSCSINYPGTAKLYERCLSFRMYVFDVVRVANNVDEQRRKGINIVCEMRALMNDKKITSENAFVTVTVSQLEERIDRSSLIRPHTPGLERANRRYRIVIAEQKGDRYRLTSAEDGAPTPPNSVSPPRVKTFAAMSLADEGRCVIPAAKHGTDPWWGFTGWGWGVRA